MAKHKETASEKTQAPAAYGKHLISRQVPETVADTTTPDIDQPAEEPAPAAGFVDVPVITPDDLPKIAIEKDEPESKSSLKPKLESVLKLKLKPEPKSEPEPKPTVAPVPAIEPEPAVEPESEPKAASKPEPVAEPESKPEPEPEPKDEPAAEAEAPADSESTDEPKPEKKPRSESNTKFALPIVIGIAVAALVIGLLIGMFALGGGSHSSAITGKTTIAESELDTPIAAYACNGAAGTVTVRDVILQTSSLDAAKDANGNYKVPTADATLGVVRNKLLVEEAESQGITVTDADVAAYAQGSLGTDDFSEIATSYGMDPVAVESLLRESCLMGKLRGQIVAAEEVTLPDPPKKPESADEAAPTKLSKEYADYIIALAGKEWNKSKNTWASEDGPYAKALAGVYDISSAGASYEAAAAAYYVAYQQYAEEADESNVQWTEYVNSILGDSTIQLYTMLA